MKKPVCFLFILHFSVFAAGLYAEDLTIYALKGPSGVGMVKMFETPPEIPEFTVKMEALPGADLMAARFLSGDAKVGILPPNVAAKIASSGKKIQIAAVTGLGMLSLLTSSTAIKGIEDLRGKTLAVSGQGAVPEYVFKKILQFYKIDATSGIRLDFSLAYPEIAASLISGRIKTALLPEPFATMAKTGSKNTLRDVADIQTEWENTGGTGNYAMTVLVVETEFAAKNPAAMQIIMDSYKDSINFVVNNPKSAAILVEKHDFGLKAAVVEAAIPKSNYVFIYSKDAKSSLETLFSAFLEFEPVSIGGKLPDNGFYYGAE